MRESVVTLMLRTVYHMLYLALGALPMLAQDGAAPSLSQQNAALMHRPGADLQSFMLKAFETNGLSAPGLPAWHLKVSFRLLDDKGAEPDQGTYEEFWVSPEKFKRIYISKGFTQTDYGTDKGVFRTGEQKWAPYLLRQVCRSYVDPLPNAKDIQNDRISSESHGNASRGMFCVHDLHRQAAAAGELNLLIYCFVGDTTHLSISILGPDELQRFPVFETTRSKGIFFQGRLVPSDFQVSVNMPMAPSLVAHLETMEAIGHVDEALFIPPADAQIPPQPSEIAIGPVPIIAPLSFGSAASHSGEVAVSASVATGLLTMRVQPVYPPAALDAHVSGSVVLDVAIGKDGTVQSARAVSGPSLLQQAAVDAVKQWVYRPFLNYGEPAKLRTTVIVVFSLPQAAKPNVAAPPAN